jgi:hypothetical protein
MIVAAQPSLASRLRDGAGIAFIVGGGLGFFYLTSGHGRLEFSVLPGSFWAGVVAVTGFLVILLLLTTSILDRVPWHGEVRLPASDGFSWSRSALSRLLIVLFGASGLWGWTAFVGMVVQAWYQADWGRLVVAVLLGLISGALALRVVFSALSRKAMLTLDRNGLFERRLGRLAWSEIEKIGVGRDPSGRQVYLFLNAGRALCPARTLRLDEVGLTCGRFVGIVEQIAPQVVIDRPQPPAPPLFA